jgi:hypothetical protein
MTKLFFSQSYKDIGRRKCNFCLAFCSVFIVVLSTLIISTIVDFGPIIFLKLGETKQGQYDAVFYPTEENFKDFESFTNENGVFLNYT